MFGWFKSKRQPATAMDAFIEAAYGKKTKKTADLSEAISLASENLLDGVFKREAVTRMAIDLYNGPVPYSTHDLAAAVALAILRKVPIEQREQLGGTQIKARQTVVSWLVEGKVVPLLAKTFEDALYHDYHPRNWS